MKSLIILSLFIFLASCTTYKGPSSYKIKENIYYKDSNNERFKAELYISDKSQLNPTVILVHGGGWNSRSFEDTRSIAHSLSSHGFTVLNINYRFAPENIHPAPIEDLDAAITYLKKNATSFKVDPNRIALWGYSSGGHTVSYYALTRSSDPAKRVQAVVTGGAPYDFTWYPKSPYIKAYMGKYRDEMLTEYIKASPSSLVTADAPPFFYLSR